MDEAKKGSVLIVDDETPNLKVLTHILSSEYTIYTAKDGLTAVEMAKKYMPDLILLDVVMTDMDGYEVLSILKASDKTRAIPIIFISGLNSSEDEEKGLALGAVDYIGKPFSAATVKSKVQKQIYSNLI